VARWLELTVEANVEAVEAVSEIFGRLGRGAAVRPTRLIRDPRDELAVREDPSAPYLVTAHVPDDGDSAAALEATERALWHLQAFGLGPVGALHVSSVEDSGWEAAWKAGYTPQRIGRVVIVPSWLDEPIADGEVELRLDPGMAFGTGLHPTTRGCLALLQRVDPMPSPILDVGCGSGILALAALRLGARRAICYDTDPLAVATTGANAAANALADRLEARRGTLPAVPAERVRLVMANLVAAVLVELAERLAVHCRRGGTLIASGIIAERGEEVGSALRAAGFVERDRLEDGDWLTLGLERT